STMNSLRFSATMLSATGAGGVPASAGAASLVTGGTVASADAPAWAGTARGRGRTKACQITRTATDRETARSALRSISGHRIDAARVKRMAVGKTPEGEK